MTGALRSNKINVCEEKVGKSLKRLDPHSQRQRQETAGRSLNPKCYSADYFGHKIHIDQNEKLVMFGVTHVMARDGFSGMIVAFTNMPIKNNLVIYDQIYKKSAMEYGLWDQVRIDGGKEFVLICHIQEMMRDQRRNQSIEPFKSTKSTENNIIERMWVEVNSRVNYPLKSALNRFIQQGDIDFSSEYTKYAVSWVTCRVSYVGLKRFVDAWNHHSIPKKGRPIDLMASNNRAASVSNMLGKEEAAEHYECVTSRTLTRENEFGTDPLSHCAELRIRRETEMTKKCCFDSIFSDVQQHNTTSFLFCIQHFIVLSNALLVC